MDVLKQNGIVVVQDCMLPGEADGLELTEISRVNILNASFSKTDALGYRVERVIAPHRDNMDIMRAINNIRHATGQGRVATSSWDSTDDVEEKLLLKSILEYCQKTGTELITDAMMYDICFQNAVTTGNLLTNASLRNTMQEWLGDGTEDQCPDGFMGDCMVSNDGGYLVVNGFAANRQYGVPIGDLHFNVSGEGYGEIRIYAIRNNTILNGHGELLAEKKISKKGSYRIDFSIIESPLISKICGIEIQYVGELKLHDLELIKL